MCRSLRRRLPSACRQFTWGVVVAMMSVSCLEAHQGPPFPILMDQRAGGYVVSVWADPDIGDALFYVVVESPSGGPPAEAPQIAMWVTPASGRLPRATYATERQLLRNQLQFEARPYFDQRDKWTVGIRLVGPDGQAEELTTEVESTPPGYGSWDLAVYLFPFVLLGGMWVIAMIRRHRAQRSQSQRLAF